MSAAIAIQTTQQTTPMTLAHPRQRTPKAAAQRGRQQQPRERRVERIPAAPEQALAKLGELLNAATSEADGLAWISAHAGTWPLLSSAQEITLARRVRRGDAQAREQMILCNLRLVLAMAIQMRLLSGHLEVCDLAQEGFIGLMRAIERFDPQRGWKLSTYATWWIAQAMQRATADTGYPIRLPVYLYHRRRILVRLRGQMIAELQREPTMDELADAYNERGSSKQRTTGDEVALLLVVQQPLTSLQVTILREARAEEETGHRRVGDQVSDERADTAFEVVEATADGGWLLEVARYALRAPHDATEAQQRTAARNLHIFLSRALHPEIAMETLGRQYGITRERVRQIEEKANKQVRAAVIACGGTPVDYHAEEPIAPPKHKRGRRPKAAATKAEAQ